MFLVRCVCMELVTHSETAECRQTDRQTTVSGWRHPFNVLQVGGRLIFLEVNISKLSGIIY